MRFITSIRHHPENMYMDDDDYDILTTTPLDSMNNSQFTLSTSLFHTYLNSNEIDKCVQCSSVYINQVNRRAINYAMQSHQKRKQISLSFR